MEEDIKILENVLKTKEYGLCEITDTFYKAIENLLKGYKELEIENKKLNKLDISNSSLIASMSERHYHDREKIRNSIPISVIQKKIDELNKEDMIICFGRKK